MRHYEVVFFAHPGQSEQIPSMIDRYKEMVTSAGGTVHRVEDWGRRKLAYPVNKLHKAHYVLMNIECNQEALANLQYNFRFNDIVLRFLVMSKKSAETQESAMLVESREEKAQEEKARSRFASKDRVERGARKPAPADEAPANDSKEPENTNDNQAQSAPDQEAAS